MKYLPLHHEIVVAATEADKMWGKTFCPILTSGSLDGEIRGYKNIDGKVISLELVDAETAKSAETLFVNYQRTRKKLKYRFSRAPASEEKFKMYTAGYNRHIRVHSDDYIPGEFTEVLSDILWAAAHYYPVSSEMLSSMTAFVQTFAAFDILSISISMDRETPDLREIVLLHKSLVKLARLLVASLLDHKPITIEIGGSAKHLSVSVDNNPVKLSPTQVRGVAALSLLEYDHWFFADEFCRIAFPDDAYEPRKQFDAALSVLKKFPPFGWDADEGIRKITGAVVRPAVDKAVLQAFLKQKKSL